MTAAPPFQDRLFAEDFLLGFIHRLPDWKNLSDTELSDLEGGLQAVFDRFPATASPNEDQIFFP